MTGSWFRNSTYSGWRTLRAAVAPAKRAVFREIPRATKDYATHVPVLVGLATAFRIATVLEFGCGEFSTITFLNRSVFPDLARLDTYENDQLWLQKISQLNQSDSRLNANYTEGEMQKVVQDLCLDQYDLVFVDDSTSAQQRARTIAEIAASKCESLVVIHDFEVQEYQQAARSFEHCFIFKAYNPLTGVVWNGDYSKTKRMKRIHTLLKRYARSTEPDALTSWEKVFSNQLT
jgi:hypothetical protein